MAVLGGRLALVRRETLGQQLTGDGLWDRIRREAEDALAGAPMLAPLFLDSIINQSSFESAVFHRVASRLKNDVVSSPLIVDTFNQAVADDPLIAEALRADIAAVLERDPACERLIEPFLYFKGFHSLQTHRLAHWLWINGARDFAFYLQSRSSDVFQTDIHPAAKFGKGIFLDHATGLVVGETAVIDDDVCLLQNVTLGGTGKETRDRHPKVRKGAMIGAGAKILGNIEIGEYTRVAAGSVVLRATEPHSTVAGIPAKAVKTTGGAGNGAEALDQILSDLNYNGFNYSI